MAPPGVPEGSALAYATPSSAPTARKPRKPQERLLEGGLKRALATFKSGAGSRTCRTTHVPRSGPADAAPPARGRGLVYTTHPQPWARVPRRRFGWSPRGHQALGGGFFGGVCPPSLMGVPRGGAPLVRMIFNVYFWGLRVEPLMFICFPL